MQTPKVPKPVQAKPPLEPATVPQSREESERRYKGRSSYISAGRITTKAKTVKSSLLGVA